MHTFLARTFIAIATLLPAVKGDIPYVKSIEVGDVGKTYAVLWSEQKQK
jgi:hypothetical protein